MRTLLNVRMAMVVAVSAVVMTACGGAGGASSPTMPSLADASSGGGDTTTTVVPDGEDALLEYAACMRDNGIDMPDPTPGQAGAFVIEGSEGDFGDFEAADRECSSLLDGAFSDFEMTPEEVAEMQDQELAFAQCMRDNGIDMPDPSFDGTASSQLSTDDFDPEAMGEATDTCVEEVFGEPFGGFGAVDSVSGTP